MIGQGEAVWAGYGEAGRGTAWRSCLDLAAHGWVRFGGRGGVWRGWARLGGRGWQGLVRQGRLRRSGNGLVGFDLDWRSCLGDVGQG